MTGNAAVTAEAAGPGKLRLASPPTAVVLGVVVVALIAAAFPLGHLAHLGVSSGGSELVLGPVFGVIGFIVAWRKPANPLGWLLLGAVAFLAITGDASAYAVADYRWHHGALPLGWVAMLLQPAWAPAIALFGLSVLLFPDGRPPGRRWRWWLWGYLAVAAAWIAGTIIITAGAIIAHNIHVDSAGDLQALNHPAGPSAWWGAVQSVFFPVLGACWLASLSYRRSSGERRLQLKWLLGGSAIAAAGGLVTVPLGDSPDRVLKILGGAGLIAVLALPVSMGVAILKYRLYDIDRILSRTVAYAIITGFLVGIYAGLVLLATEVLRFSSPVAVAASTLAAAALFNPVRHRVQRAVDRRFNRARYDADRTVAAFAGRLKDEVDLDMVRADLGHVVGAALEPAHVSVWLGEEGR